MMAGKEQSAKNRLQNTLEAVSVYLKTTHIER